MIAIAGWTVFKVASALAGLLVLLVVAFDVAGRVVQRSSKRDDVEKRLARQRLNDIGIALGIVAVVVLIVGVFVSTIIGKDNARASAEKQIVIDIKKCLAVGGEPELSLSDDGGNVEHCWLITDGIRVDIVDFREVKP